MSWCIGYDENWDRDIGYGVPAICDYPDCDNKIDRGLSYVCGGQPYGGDTGCGLFFCQKHQMDEHQRCERCCRQPSFSPKPDTEEWIRHKLTDDSWKQWREQNKEEVEGFLEKPLR